MKTGDNMNLSKQEKAEIKANKKRDKKFKKYINKIMDLGEFDLMSYETQIDRDFTTMDRIFYDSGSTSKFALNTFTGIIRFKYRQGKTMEIK